MSEEKHNPPVGATPLWAYPNAYAGTDEAQLFYDTDEQWEKWLPDPEVITDKRNSPAICALEFVPGASSKRQNPENYVASWGLVLDVDCWRSDRPPFTFAELQERLEGIRFICWTSYSSTASHRKWRLYIPFATSMPPSKQRACWRIANTCLDGAMSEKSTSDPGRLGFVGTVASDIGAAEYEFHIVQGERLDWTRMNLEDEELTSYREPLKPADLSRSPDWSTDDEALAHAKRYYRNVGRDVDVGSRHECLFRASNRLWWDWAAPTEEFVRAVLEVINNNFAEPKSDEEVEKEIKAGFDRTLGEHRVEQPTSYGAEREPIARATLLGFSEHARHLVKKKSDQARLVGRALKSIAEGETFADPVEGRAVALQVAAAVAHLYPRENSERLISLLRPAFNAQRARSHEHPLPTDAELVAKIEWAQKSKRKELEEREQASTDKQKRQMLQAFKGQRDTEYTVREVKEWQQQNGFNPSSEWILQHGGNYYMFVAGEFQGPYRKEAANNFAPMLLSPARHWVPTEFVDGATNKTRVATIDELTQRHGSLVDNVQRSLIVAKSEYQRDTRTLIHAVGKQRELIPARSSSVEEWLRLLAGSKYEELCGWLATVTFLDRPSVGVYVAAKTGAGKNLLGCGVARVWTEAGPTRLTTYEPQFLEQCPLVFCDEALPPSWAKSFSTRFREFITEESRIAKQMWVEKYTLIGYPRLLFVANNTRMLTDTAEGARGADMQAVRDRVLMIDATNTDAPVEYLKQHEHRSFVTEDLIAKHVLWLRDTRKVSDKKRFFVTDPDKQFEHAFTVSHSGRSQALEWIYEFLVARKFPNTAVVAKDGRLYVNSSAMMAYWKLYDAQSKGVRTRELMTAISSLSDERLHITVGKDRTWYRRLNMEMFNYWIEQNDGNVEQIKSAIEDLEKKKPIELR